MLAGRSAPLLWAPGNPGGQLCETPTRGAVIRYAQFVPMPANMAPLSFIQTLALLPILDFPSTATGQMSVSRAA